MLDEQKVCLAKNDKVMYTHNLETTFYKNLKNTHLHGMSKKYLLQAFSYVLDSLKHSSR